ncbi:hypothetical protein BGZ51_006083 [Haplosporangium sp. Z 767]|nr:hypothetical protein BGZ51_006083 [Haplosporangium sp. Z 767]
MKTRSTRNSSEVAVPAPRTRKEGGKVATITVPLKRKITKYPPTDNQAKVSRFGNIKPKTIVVECSASNIIPFEHESKESYHQSGAKSSYAQTFISAFRDANEAQIKDDDDLPSLDEALNQSPSAPALASIQHLKLDKDKSYPRKFARTESNYMLDSSLTIPGELVLACPDRLYYPGRIMDFNNKTNKYKIQFAYGSCVSLERKKLFTRYEKGFQTCPLGEMEQPKIHENFSDEELESQVRDVFPGLYTVITGTHDESGRLKAFLKGGKEKRALAQRVGPGQFTRDQYALIHGMLQTEFLPDLSTTKRICANGPPRKKKITQSEPLPMKRERDITRDFSDQMRLHFVTDVLLPETITRLTMRRNNLEYQEAEKLVLQGTRDESTDIWWVDDILAARESFLDGHRV